MTNGELPNDMEWIGKVVRDICYYNARQYFNFQPAWVTERSEG